MEEIVFWKEVDVKDELPEDNKWVNVINYGNVLYKSKQFYFIDGEGEKLKFSPTHWLKRVVIPIDPDKEIELAVNYSMQSNPLSMKDPLLEYVRGVMKCGFLSGYKAMQERLINKEGL